MCLPEDADITFISDQSHFLFKPNMIYIPFGMDSARLKLNLEKPTSNKAIGFLCARVREIDPVSMQVQVDGYRLVIVGTKTFRLQAPHRPLEQVGVLEATAGERWVTYRANRPAEPSGAQTCSDQTAGVISCAGELKPPSL